MSLLWKRLIQFGMAIVAGGFAVAQVYGVYEGYIHRSDYLYWDPAAHAYYGIKLTVALQSLNPLTIASATNEQVLWPPLHSYLQFPFMLFLGRNFLASSICSLTFLFLFFISLTYCYQQVSEDSFGLIFLLVLAGSSPFLLAYGTMPMLEIFGAVLTSWSAALYIKGSRWFPLSLALLFFLKYNYCFYLLMAVAAVDMGPFIVERLRRNGSEVLSLLTPFRVFVICYLLGITAILITGGFIIGNLKVRGIGNPLYFLYLLLITRIIVKKQYVSLWKKMRGTGWQWFVVPVGLWLLIPVPNRIRTLVSFAINSPLSGHSPGELSYYTYYFENLQKYFTSLPMLIVTVLLAVGCLLKRRHEKNILFLVALFVLPLLLMTLNQNKQERYLYSFVFSLWLLAAFFITTLTQKSVRVICVVLLCGLAIFSYDHERLSVLVSWPFPPMTIEAPVKFIAEELAAAQEIVVLGSSNEMSPALLAYHIQKKSDFKTKQRFSWKLERDLPRGADIIVIERSDTPTNTLPSSLLKLVKTRNFKTGINVTHYLAQ